MGSESLIVIWSALNVLLRRLVLAKQLAHLPGWVRLCFFSFVPRFRSPSVCTCLTLFCSNRHVHLAGGASKGLAQRRQLVQRDKVCLFVARTKSRRVRLGLRRVDKCGDRVAP